MNNGPQQGYFTARIFGWIEWCNLCDPEGSRPNNGPQQGYLGGLSGAIYAIRRDHGRTMGHSKDIWVD